MSGSRLEAQWAPAPSHGNKFVVWGADIALYEVLPFSDAETKSSSLKISSNSSAQLIVSQSGTGVRCVDICGDDGLAEPLLALGYTTGAVSLTSLGQNVDAMPLAGKEFVPKHSRLCNSVSWSPIETNILAVALDKHRSDHCILLWDVHKELRTAPVGSSSSSIQPSEQPRPLAEMGLSETAHSVTWAHSSSRTLLASMNMKYIKIFDLRDLSNKAVRVTTSRHCFGVCADPTNEWQVASRGDTVAAVWDTRNFDTPLLTISQPRQITKIMWCPTRRNLLCSLQRDSTSLNLHDVQQQQAHRTQDTTLTFEPCQAGSESETGSSAHVVSRAVCAGAAPLASFSWHPRHRARLLLLTAAGTVQEQVVCERVSVSWGAGTGGLVWSAGGELRALPEPYYLTLQDISHVMKKRALTDYGLKSDLWQNADLADDEALSNLWNFLALSKSLVEDGCIKSGSLKHPGVRSVLRPETEGGYRSEVQSTLMPDLPNRRVNIYKSNERTRALQLCSWGWGWENVSAGLERAEAEGQWCRAAALAAFHLRLRTALDILSRAPQPQLRVVALALAGLSEERLWRSLAGSAATALTEPYLRALLHFLAATSASGAPPPGSDMQQVLNESEMRLEDRVAFACIFLSDSKLHDYIRGLTDALVEQGDLSGILLTGASPEGISLVQRWLETTGDVQSAALVAARSLPSDLLKDPRPTHWIDSYRSLLDSWQLWWARCALDTWVSASGGALGAAGGGGGLVYARQVCIACGYCGKTVSSPGGPPRPRPAFARLPPPAAKMKQISACPHCRKPLPRCAVCSLHLGTGAGSVCGAGALFPAWFTWCVACRHAGHAAHLLQWFKEHSECPVSSCTCRCATLDPPGSL